MDTTLNGLNKRLLVALGLDAGSAQIVIDRIDELERSERALKAELADLRRHLQCNIAEIALKAVADANARGGMKGAILSAHQASH